MQRFIRNPFLFLTGLLCLAAAAAASGAATAYFVHAFHTTDASFEVKLVGVSATLALGPAGYAIGYIADEVGLGQNLVLSNGGMTMQADVPGTYSSITANAFRAVYGY